MKNPRVELDGRAGALGAPRSQFNSGHPDRLDEAVRRFIAESKMRLSPRTIESYALRLEWLCDFARRARVDRLRDLDAKMLQAWLVETIEVRKASPHVVALCVFAVRTFTRWAARLGLLDRPHGDALWVPRIPRALPRVLDFGQVLELLEAPDTSTWLGIRDAAILHLLYGSGLRVSEACGLLRADVNLVDKSALVLGKGRRQRLVPLGDPCAERISRWLDVRGDCSAPELFVGRHGTALTRRTVEARVKDYASELGFRCTPHFFRHACATHMLQGGADLRSIQAFLGHARLSTTEIYTHVAMTDVRKAHANAHPLARSYVTAPAEDHKASSERRNGPGLAKAHPRSFRRAGQSSP